MIESPYVIRRIRKQELQTLLELYSHLHDSDLPLPEPGIIDTVWEEIMLNEHFIYWGGFLGKELVASCTCSIIPNLTRSCRPYAVIENVVTHSQYRRKGLAKKLLQEALKHAWQLNCYKAMLMTGRKDQGTYQFYQSVGFEGDSKQAFLAKPEYFPFNGSD